MGKRIGSLAIVIAALVFLSGHGFGQVIGSGHVLGNGTSSPRTPTDTSVIGVMNQPGGGLGSGVAAALAQPSNSTNGFVTGSKLPGGASGSAANTTATCAASSASVTLASAQDFVDTQGIALEHCGATFTGAAPTALAVASTGLLSQGPAGSTTYAYEIACVDDNGGVGAAVGPVSISNGAATLGAISQTGRTIAFNYVSWTTTCPGIAVWRNKAGAGYHLIGVYQSSLDDGSSVTDNGQPQVTIPWIPDTPPVAALNDRLVTTITSGGGSTTLSLGGAAINTASNAYVRHDDTAALSAVLSSNASVSIPAGTYNIESLTLPSTVASLVGAGQGATIIQGWSGATAMLTASSPPAGFLIAGMDIVPVATSNVTALSLSNASSCSVRDLNLSGNVVVALNADTRCSISRIKALVWYDRVISSTSGVDNIIEGIIASPGLTPAASEIITDSSANGDIISDNNLSGGDYFGIVVKNSNAVTVTSNTLINSLHEAIHLSQNGQSNVFSSNNVFGNLSSIDYCISISDDGAASITESETSIVNNYLYNCGTSAIAVSEFGGTTPLIQYTNISGNTIAGPNVDHIASTPGILVNGSGVTGTFISANTTLNTGNMDYIVEEKNIFGLPQFTEVFSMFGQVGVTGTGKAQLSGTGSSAASGASSGL
jgi:hypothetical protein